MHWCTLRLRRRSRRVLGYLQRRFRRRRRGTRCRCRCRRDFLVGYRGFRNRRYGNALARGAGVLRRANAESLEGGLVGTTALPADATVRFRGRNARRRRYPSHGRSLARKKRAGSPATERGRHHEGRGARHCPQSKRRRHAFCRCDFFCVFCPPLVFNSSICHLISRVPTWSPTCHLSAQ